MLVYKDDYFNDYDYGEFEDTSINGYTISTSIGKRKGYTNAYHIVVNKDEVSLVDFYIPHIKAYNIGIINDIPHLVTTINDYRDLYMINLETLKTTRVYGMDSFCYVMVAINNNYIITSGCYWAMGYEFRIYHVDTKYNIKLTNVIEDEDEGYEFNTETNMYDLIYPDGTRKPLPLENEENSLNYHNWYNDLKEPLRI